MEVMALFIQKPILWNTNSYRSPSGVIAHSGYPKEKGYGHEEWNNSSKMLLKRDKQRFRVFHTEGIGEAPLEQNAGQTFVFLTTSHDKVQQLVGIAGNAIGLFAPHYKAQREQIAADLGLYDLWKEAWEIPNVRLCHENNQKRFLKDWDKDLHWIANWICPDEFYWWFDEPVTLNAQSITGKRKLLQMFGSYTELDLPTVGRLLDAIPETLRKEKWERLTDAILNAPTEPVSSDETSNNKELITSVLTTINARRGQGQFRENLMKIWSSSCAVTGLDCREILRASHIKPWASSTNRQKRDENN
jgi:hypothetical protein